MKARLFTSLFIICVFYTQHSSALTTTVASFETDTDLTNWTSKALSLSSPGSNAAFWTSTVNYTVVTNSKIIHDWTPYDTMQFWMYSGTNNNALIMLILYSENATSSGIDYFSTSFTMNFVGWKFISLKLSSLSKTRSPIGFSKIDNIYFTSSWGNAVPVAGTVVGFDDIVLTTQQLVLGDSAPFTYYLAPSTSFNWNIQVQGANTETNTFWISRNGALPTGTTLQIQPTSFTIVSNATATFNLKATATANAIPGAAFPIALEIRNVKSNSSIVLQFDLTLQIVQATNTIKTRPFVLLDKSMNSSLLSTDYKRSIVQGYITRATSALSIDLTVPIKWGAWGGYYVCTDGTYLRYNASSPDRFYCPSSDTYYTGEPYAGAWVTNRHNQLNDVMYDSAMAYFFTGNATYARTASMLLLKYASFYSTIPIRDIDFRVNGGSGGHILSQTLDEAIWCTGATIAYDLVASTMNATEQALVEYNLLRALVTTVQRNDAGTSNWQSWHNAAIAGVGFLFEDAKLYNVSIYGKSGFLFQIKNSMLDDGIWFENSIGYHFFTIQALSTHMYFAQKFGIDLGNMQVPKTNGTGTKTIQSMFSAPLYLLNPSTIFPALNDGGDQQSPPLSAYEFAHNLYSDKLYDWILGVILGTKSRNSFESLVYGKSYSSENFEVPSYDLPNMGVSVLRNSNSSYLLSKYGPHGGWHGHYDKGTIILYKNKELVTDYGSAPYRLPLHTEYMKRTLSHSTIITDGNCQLETEGKLEFGGHIWKDVSIVSSSLGTIWANGPIRRTLVTFAQNGNTDLIIDLFQVEPTDTANHDYFHVLHSGGNFHLLSGGSLSDYPGGALSFGTQEPMWNYLNNPRTISQIPAGTTLRYEWSDETTYSDSFENIDDWSKLVLSNTYVKNGSNSGLWGDHGLVNQIQKTRFPSDWTSMQRISFWVYNEVINNETITLVMYSENTTSSGIDYFSRNFKLNFVGWNQIKINKTEFSRARSPIGWNSITGIVMSCSWTSTCIGGTRIWIDEFQVWDASGNIVPDVKSPGLHVISQDTKSKQFIVADAPNNPATSYHPVAISRITTNSSFWWNHLLVAGNTTGAQSTSFTATHTSTISNYTITANSVKYMVTLYRSASVVTGMLFYNPTVNKYTAYSVANLRHKTIVLNPVSGTVSAQLEPTMTNGTRCEFKVSSPQNLVATCDFGSLTGKSVQATIGSQTVTAVVSGNSASVSIPANSTNTAVAMQVVAAAPSAQQDGENQLASGSRLTISALFLLALMLLL